LTFFLHGRVPTDVVGPFIQIPAVMSNLSKELKSKVVKPKSRAGIFQLLKELIHAFPGALSGYAGDAVAGIITSLNVFLIRPIYFLLGVFRRFDKPTKMTGQRHRR